MLTYSAYFPIYMESHFSARVCVRVCVRNDNGTEWSKNSTTQAIILRAQIIPISQAAHKFTAAEH